MHFPQIHGSPLSHAAGVTAPPEGEELNLSVSADALPPPLPRGGFGIPQSERFRQRLPYQGQPRRPPPVAETGRSCWGSGQQDASGSEADAGSRNPALSSEARLRGCTKTEPFLCRKVRLLAFPVSFWRNVWYNGFAVHPAYLTGEEVDALAYFLTFLVSVGADVVSHFICKWLDRCEENRKA